MQTMTELGGHDLHLSVRQRAQIVNAVLVEGTSYRAVARELGLHHKTVSNTIKKFNESHDLHEHPSGGRPSAYDDDDLYRLECLIDQEPSATAERLVELMGPEAPAADITTIRRYRRVLGYTRRKPAIWEIDTERSARLRDAWLFEQKHSNPQRWVYMDESTLCLRDTGEYVWIKSGKRTPKHEIEHLRCSINVWGAVWKGGATFCFYEGHLTGASYCDILNEHLLPYKGQFKRRHILHDAAPSHMAKKVKEWFTDQRLDVLVLPPHSPQFNAIEEVWAWLKHEVRTKHPMNEQQLKDACEQAWNSLSQEKINSYIAHASALIKNA